MTAGTQIESLVEKKKEIYDKAANLLASAIMERSSTDRVAMNTKRDITNVIKGFTPEEQVEILTTALVILGMNGRFNMAPSNKNNKKTKKPSPSKTISSVFRNGYNEEYDDDDDDDFMDDLF